LERSLREDRGDTIAAQKWDYGMRKDPIHIYIFLRISLEQTFLPFFLNSLLFRVVAAECLASLVDGTVYLQLSKHSDLYSYFTINAIIYVFYHKYRC
jgi:hypothetical protein